MLTWLFSPAELSLRQEGGFLKEVVVVVSLLSRTAAHKEWVPGGTTSGIRASQVRRGISIDSKASVADWRRSCVDLGSELGCLWDRVSISEQCKDCLRNQVGGVDCFGNSSRVTHGGKDLIFI